jgi:multiple sugar transport system substrate-binding protein
MRKYLKTMGVVLILIYMVLITTGCSKESPAEKLLDPDKPIIVTVWHYYNSSSKEAFDMLVSEFNDTVGMAKGIVIDAQSQGDISQLATAVFDAANGSIGSSPMPNIFASYPDNAFRVNLITPLVSLDSYFSQEELAVYRQEFLEEGRFITDQQYYIVPIAKSSENLYINQNAWEPFASAYGYTTEDLSTWEGLYAVSKAYREATGKGFFSLDASANYMLVTAMAYGQEMYVYNTDGTAVFQMSEAAAHKIWDIYYQGYLNGYFVKTGRFSSDDAKTGTVVSYTGSTAGAAYFPLAVVIGEQEPEAVDPIVLPYPQYEGREKLSIQQGAGMCIAHSDEAHEYAAALFLKWFTAASQNTKFAVSTGYFPVTNDALNGERLDAQAVSLGIDNQAILGSIEASKTMFESYRLYNSKPFDGSYDMRDLLETHLFNKVSEDLTVLDEAVQNGEDRESVIKAMTSEDAFQIWYDDLKTQAEQILKQQ